MIPEFDRHSTTLTIPFGIRDGQSNLGKLAEVQWVTNRFRTAVIGFLLVGRPIGVI